MTKKEYTADEIKALFGEPPLIRGESKEDYWKLWSAFVEDLKPKSLPDWIEVTELANKQWEQGRLRRCNPALVEGALGNALKELLQPFNAIGISPTELARDYYAADLKTRQKANEKVARCGITDDQILAEAMQMRSSALIAFDRMDSYRASAKRMLLKDIERRSEARKNPAGQTDNQP